MSLLIGKFSRAAIVASFALTLVISSTFSSFPCIAQESGLKTFDQKSLQAIVSKTAKELLIPGALVLLKTPKGNYTATYGTTKIGSETAPAANTHFRIASNTKTMTAAVILQLAQEDRLKLTDPISKYVGSVPNGDKITIANLLEMRSGLYNYTNAPEVSASIDKNPSKAWTTAELMQIAFKHAPVAAPNSVYEYNNTNFSLLGLVIEKIEKRQLAAVFNDRLFKPLDLKNTELPIKTSFKLAEPYSHGYMYGPASVALYGEPDYTPKLKAAAKSGKLQPTDFTDVNHSFSFAAGGATSTASDMAAWTEALGSGRVFNSKFQRIWLDSVKPEDPKKPHGMKYGYGIGQMQWGGNTYYYHGGETVGFNSHIGYDPANKVTLIVWTNLTVDLEQLPTANSIMLKVLDHIYLKSPIEPEK